MSISVNSAVKHPTFGTGVVLETDGVEASVLFMNRTPGGRAKVVRKHNGKKGKAAKYVKAKVAPKETLAARTEKVAVNQLTAE